MQLTDALRLLLKRQNIYAFKIKGKRYDMGDKDVHMRSFIELSEAMER